LAAETASSDAGSVDALNLDPVDRAGNRVVSTTGDEGVEQQIRTMSPGLRVVADGVTARYSGDFTRLDIGHLSGNDIETNRRG